MNKKMYTFRIEENLLKKLKKSKKHGKVSQFINNVLSNELNNESDKSKTIKSGDWQGLKEIVNNSPSLLVAGNVGEGKSFITNELIKNDKDHKFILLSAHKDDDYNLPVQDMLINDPEYSYMIQLPKEVSASKGLFPVYINHILSKKWNNNLILVVEEANRYPEEVKQLLRESRKFIKVIAVCQEVFCSFVPHVRIVKGVDIQ